MQKDLLMPRRNNKRIDLLSLNSFKINLAEFHNLLKDDYDKEKRIFFSSLKNWLKFFGTSKVLLNALKSDLITNLPINEVKVRVQNELQKEEKKYKEQLEQDAKIALKKIKQRPKVRGNKTKKNTPVKKKKVAKKKKFRGRWITIISTPM